MPPSSPLVFPASDLGFLAQFPVSYSSRRIGPRNEFSDGTRLHSSVESRLLSRWSLGLANLSDAERERFESFLAEAAGDGREFLFFDPIGNLLSHSVDLENAIWTRTGALDVAPFNDPSLGPAFVVTNTSLDWRSLEQTISFGHGFQACFSVLAKWDSSIPFRLRLVDSLGISEVGAQVHDPRRVFVRRLAGATIASTTVSLDLAPNTQIILAQPQLEIGAFPSAYLPTGSRSGVVSSAWLGQREYRWQTEAPNAHAINLEIESIRI